MDSGRLRSLREQQGKRGQSPAPDLHGQLLRLAPPLLLAREGADEPYSEEHRAHDQRSLSKSLFHHVLALRP